MRAHLAIDVRDEASHWVRSRAGRDGLVPLTCGRIERSGTTDLSARLRELARSSVARGARIEVALRGEGLVHQREDLPKLHRREAALVAARRAPEVEAAVDGPASFCFSRAENGEGPLWLCAAPVANAREAVLEWRQRGFEIDRLSSRHLALGNLVRLLDLPEKSLVAFFDLEPDQGTCVVADCRGWVFSREVPLRFMGDRLLRAARATPAVEAAREPVAHEEASGLLLVGEKEDGPDEALDRLEAVADQAERLATELRRTFQYVGGQLGMGNVGRVHLTGGSPLLDDLTASLSQALGIPVESFGSVAADRLSGADASSCVALGLALAPDRSGGNLLPSEERKARLAVRTRRRLRLSLVSALGLIVASGLVLGWIASSVQREIQAASSRWESDAPQRDLVQRVGASRSRSSALASALGRIDAPGPSWTALLEGLARSMPSDAFVERLEADRGDGHWRIVFSVEATGDTVAEAAHAVSRFTQAAGASPLLHIDSTVRESVARVGVDAQTRARVRFRIGGRPAPVSVAGPVDSAPSPTGGERG